MDANQLAAIKAKLPDISDDCLERNGLAPSVDKGQALAPKTINHTEDDFCRAVIAFAQLNHWKVAHFRPGMTKSGKWVTAVQGDGKGFPDLVLVRGNCLIFAELKAEKGKLSPEQENWWRDLLNAGANFKIWRPSDWPEIERILA